MPSHKRQPRTPAKMKCDFFLRRKNHHKDPCDDTISTAITSIDSDNIQTNEEVWVYPVSKKQREKNIKNNRRIKNECIENPFSHPGPDALQHLMRLGKMNSNCYFPESSFDKFGNYNGTIVCNNCIMCDDVGRTINPEKYRSYYDGYNFAGEDDNYDSCGNSYNYYCFCGYCS
jgi:hypothetical protein